jgi:hypothetical protein
VCYRQVLTPKANTRISERGWLQPILSAVVAASCGGIVAGVLESATEAHEAGQGRGEAGVTSSPNVIKLR